MLVAGLRRRHLLSGSSTEIPSQWAEFGTLPPIPGRLGNGTLGVTCGVWDGEFEYRPGTEVSGFKALPEGMGRMRILAQTYMVSIHRGPVAALPDSWRWIWEEWPPSSGLSAADTPDFESYGEGSDPAAGSGVVEIWLPVVDPGASLPVGD